MKRTLPAAAALALLLFVLGAGHGQSALAGGPPPNWEAHPPFHVRGNATTSPTGYSPAQIRHAYGFDQLDGNGAGQTIAIVDAYDDPTVFNDLAVFKNTYGISGCSLTKVNQSGGTKYPRVNSGWALEISLDVQWACAVAPGSNILLVEAANNRFNNLLAAVDYAAAHAHVVSMSWGGSEFSSESSYDGHFKVSGVTFTASSGDSGTGTIYPSVSPYVVAVGGTTLPLNASGNLTGAETAWSGSGGGISTYEGEPSWQLSFPIPNTGGKRGVPDVSYDANPNTGVSVYDTTKYQGQSGWFTVGGTSAGSPQWAALFALVNQGRGAALGGTALPDYSAATANYTGNYRDITSGTNGSCGSLCTARTGYDFVTGLGSALANNLVPYLQTH